MNLFIFLIFSLITSVISNLIVCPDKKWSCPKDMVCCQDSKGNYNKCCPFSNGICCKDNSFCCPFESNCKRDFCFLLLVQQKVPFRNTISADVYIEKEVKKEKENSVNVKEVLIEKLKPNDIGDVMCINNRTFCPNSETCCKTDYGFGCCPLKQAVCCPDKISCCPSGAKCVESGCSLSSKKFLFRSKLPSMVCPDKETECPSDSTCCPLNDQGYGCCRTVNATCCSDGIHCCPNGYSCNIKTGNCIPNYSKLTEKPFLQISEAFSYVKDCLKNQTTCGEKCCPLENAVCCQNGINCCPNGFTCDNTGNCILDDLSLGKSYNLLRSKKDPSHDCPAIWKKMKICDPEHETCCLHKDGSYGCCGFVNGVCCSDFLHCCPEGHICDKVSWKCKNGNSAKSFLKLIAKEDKADNPIDDDKIVNQAKPKDTVLKFKSQLSFVPCPNSYKCPDKTTCCLSKIGDYKCCPYNIGVCCSDKVHCCPSGYVCDVKHLVCNRTSNNNQLESVPMKAFDENSEKQKLKDKIVVKCNKDETCCHTNNGDAKKCLLPNGVCCGNIGCCPKSFQCELTNKKCIKYIRSNLPIGLYISPKRVKYERDEKEIVLCPGWKNYCKKDETCCSIMDKNEKYQYGCCPLNNAQCCKNRKHCCPIGTACTDNGCSKSTITHIKNSFLFSSAKIPDPPIIKCPDNKTECPHGETCCFIKPNFYGCCQGIDSVCCDNKRTCCPKGYRCANSTNDTTCVKENKQIIEQIAHYPIYEEKMLSNTVHFDGIIKLACHQNHTICQEKYCCPYSKGICCDKVAYCCPENTECDTINRTCLSESKQISIPIKKFL